MNKVNKNRKITRNKMWADTTVRLRYRTRYGRGSNSIAETSASIENLSSRGMFVLTKDLIPVDTDLDIQIQFNDNIGLNAAGKILRADKKGVAVKFSEIDTIKLGDCIMQRINM